MRQSSPQPYVAPADPGGRACLTLPGGCFPVRWRRRGYWATIEHDFHWHVEIIPRLTNTAGFEWGTGFYINPTIPEEAAKFLQETQV